MSKSILVIDTPERCSMCEFLKSTDEECCYCGRLGFDYQVNEYMRSMPKGKPDRCPLRDLPEKKPKVKYQGNGCFGINEAMKNSFNEGFNSCIDEILKGANGNEQGTSL